MRASPEPLHREEAGAHRPPDDVTLLDILLAEEGLEAQHRPPLRRRAAVTPALSRAQRRLWFLHELAPHSPAYNIFSALTLAGPLDRGALQAALDAIVVRHESLRTCFPAVEGRPTARLLPLRPVDIAFDDLRSLDEDRRREVVTRQCADEAVRPFDLHSGPLLRIRLLRLHEHEHVALLTMHHIVADGWSMGVLVDELSQFYGAFLRGRAPPLPEPTLQYGDYAEWQEQWLGDTAAADQRRWWKERLDRLTPLVLPTDRPRPLEPSHRGGAHAFHCPEGAAAAIKALARREGATLFIALLAAFAVLLHRYSGQEDIVVGSPVAGRTRREFEPLIGLFVNSLVMRCDLAGEPSFVEVLRRVRDFTFEALARQDLPFEEVVNELAAGRETSGNPLFQVMFALENAPRGALHLPGVVLTPIDVETRTAKLDLLLNMSETASGELAGAFEYAVDLFDADTIARMAGHFTTLLQAIAADPQQRISMLRILGENERHRLEIEWNRTERAFPHDQCIDELFEIEARRAPGAVAVEFQESRLSYGELNARADRLAGHLRRLPVAERRVALVMERSLDMVVALLAILKAGGAYVPLAPDDPDERLSLLLRDIGPAAVLTHDTMAARLSACVCPVLTVSGDLGVMPAGGGEAPPRPIRPDSPAYVVYTSGSTGAPKGVCVSHRAVVRLVRNTDYAQFGPSEVFLQLAPLAFDASTFEIWGPLLNGGKVVLAPPQRPSLSDIDHCIREHGVTTLFLTTGLFHLMVDERLEALKPLRQLLMGGDVLSVPHVLRAVRELQGCRIIACYGPTENTTFTSCFPITRPDQIGLSVPIGRPIANTRIYIVDRHLQPVPIGVPGELCISGAGLALGYAGREDLTRERFVDNPFAHDPDRRLYRTGDICRYLPDGNIQFLGRGDHQVKIRGFRVELGEVETALMRCPGVRETVVVAREDRPGKRELVAYLVSEPGQSVSPPALRQELSERLPGYMVPSGYVVLPSLPLNESGKVDRKALPAPVEVAGQADSVEPPRDPREQCLADIWQQVLGRPPGIHDNYFESGGDSIGAIQIVSRLRRSGWHIRVVDLFRHPTIAQLAPLLREETPGHEPEPATEEGDVPLTAVQRWFFAHYRGGISHFNQAVLIRPNVTLDERHLRAAVDALVARHDALRFHYAFVDGQITQSCLPTGETDDIEIVDLCRAAEPGAALERHADELQRCLDLARGPLMKVALFRLPEGDRLLLIIHHLVVDAVSWRILLEELEVAYGQLAGGQPVDLGPASSSFRRWAQVVEDLAARADLAAEEAYWLEVEHADVMRLPTAPAECPPLHGNAATLHRALPADQTTALLTTVHRAFQSEINDILLTALGRALKQWGGSEAIRVTLEGHGREPPDGTVDIARTVGWFTSLYPFVLRLPGADIGEQIRGVKAALRRVPRKGLGYGILKYVKGHPGLGLVPPPQLSFNYLGQFDGAGDGGLFSFADESTGRAIGPHLHRVHELDIGCLVAGTRMVLSLDFDPAVLARGSATALLDGFEAQLREVIAYCTSRIGPTDTSLDGVPSDWRNLPVEGEVEDVYPLSPLQEGLLFQSLFDPGSESYFCQVRLRFVGPFVREAFRDAWFDLCRRHSVLRSAFVQHDFPQPMQVVLKSGRPGITFADISHLSEAERAARLEAFCLDDRRHGFELEHGKVLRVAVFRESDDDHHIVWSYHHILIDGWCLAILQRDFLEIYSARLDRRPVQLPAAPPYCDYIHWLGRQDREAARRYWHQYLDGYDQVATLPKCLRAGDDPSSLLGEEVLALEEDQSAGLARLAARSGVTLYAVVLGLWGLALARYNDRDDVVFGSIVSGRPAELPGVEETVGLFICAVPVRVALKPDMSFIALVRALQEDALAAQPHQHLSLADIQVESALGRDLFDHMLIFENYPHRPSGVAAPRPGAVELTAVAGYDPTHYDLDLTVVPGDRLSFKFTFDRTVYSVDQLQRTAGHLRSAIASILRDPDQVLRDIDLLPCAEQDLVLARFNNTDALYPHDTSFIDQFEEQTARSPEAVALRCGDVQMSYGELDTAANRLAHHLRGLGVRVGVAVGLCVERTADMVVAPLAILKAGGTFVPLDPDYPPGRLEFMLADSGISLLLTRRHLAARLSAPAVTAVLLDADASAIEACPDSGPAHRGAAADVAYVVYTSGSTGQPKGVAVTHGSINNLVFAWREAYGLGAFPVRLLQLASMSFDVFIGDLARALTNGGMLVVCPPDAQGDPATMYQLLADHRISILESTPALVLPLMDYIHQAGLPVDFLKVLIIGSDLLPARELRKLLERFAVGLRVINSYGVSEAAIDSSLFETHDVSALAWSANAPIGRPLSNTRFYVLDRHQRPQPVAVAGELHIGGVGLADGYLNRPELTAARFVIGPPACRGERLYRTGDLARWLPDGNMEFLGRIDDQVKIRGYRIELGEVENHLLRHPSVAQALVVARDLGSGAELVAYVVADAGWNVGQAREALKQALPHFMMPAFFVRLEQLPLSPNGKIDRKALPDPRLGVERGVAFQPPRSRTETALAEIWRRVLQVEGIGVRDDFFELGGHSLKAMQMTARIAKVFGVRITPRQLFDNPTISGLCALIDAGERQAWRPIPFAPPQDHYALSHAQRRIWLLQEMEGGAAHNMPDAYLIDTEVDVGVLSRALRTLMSRHEALRTAFIVVDGEPRQEIRADVSLPLTEIDLRDRPDAKQRARAIADREANLPFELTAPPLLRVGLVHLPGGRSLFTLTMHHIIGDGWSGNVLYRELLTLYDAYLRGRPDPLKPLRIQYKDFAHWQNGRGFAAQERYWLSRLVGMPERVSLPYDFAPSAARDFSGARELVDLRADVVTGLRQLAAARRTTLPNVILALFKLLLFHWTRQEDLCVGMSVANRSHPDVENLIGFFVNILPIRCRLFADMDFDDLLAEVVEATQEALEHQDYPLDLMIERINPARAANRQPVVNVIYGFQNFADVHVDVLASAAAPDRSPDEARPGVAWEAMDLSFDRSKFDLTLLVSEESETIRVMMEFDNRLFLAETIRRQVSALADFAATVAAVAKP